MVLLNSLEVSIQNVDCKFERSIPEKKITIDKYCNANILGV